MLLLGLKRCDGCHIVELTILKSQSASMLLETRDDPHLKLRIPLGPQIIHSFCVE